MPILWLQLRSRSLKWNTTVEVNCAYKHCRYERIWSKSLPMQDRWMDRWMRWANNGQPANWTHATDYIDLQFHIVLIWMSFALISLSYGFVTSLSATTAHTWNVSCLLWCKKLQKVLHVRKKLQLWHTNESASHHQFHGDSQHHIVTHNTWN